MRVVLLLCCLLFFSVCVFAKTSLKHDYPFYHTSAQITEALQELNKTCSRLNMRQVTRSNVTLDVVDISPVSGQKSENRFFMLFGEHARELISAESGLSFVKALCSNGADGPPLPDSEFRVIVNANPLSRAEVENGDYCRRVNEDGVDLNRNWDSHWQKGSSRGVDTSPGPTPFSEPETRIIKNEAQSFQPRGFSTIHSGTLGIYSPPAFTDKDEVLSGAGKIMHGIIKSLSQKYCQCPYGGAAEQVGYSCPGTSLDYMVDHLNVSYSWAAEIYANPQFEAELRARYDALELQPFSFLQRQNPGSEANDDTDVPDFASDRCFDDFNPGTEAVFNSVLDNWTKAYLAAWTDIANALPALEEVSTISTKVTIRRHQ